VCGNLGSDPIALPILIGVGIHEVSAVPAAVPELKRIARGLDTRACRELAQRALALEGAAAVRALAHEWSRARAGAPK
jgi:phosphoenolpyruvate-protein kinase (PTS system EI component)